MQELSTYGLEGGRLNYVRFRKYSQLYIYMYVVPWLHTHAKKVIELLTDCLTINESFSVERSYITLRR